MSRAIFRDAKNHRRFGLGSGPLGCPKARSRRFDAGVGPVGLPEKTFSATVEASATAWEGRVARARFRNFGAGSWPVATAEASATAMANPRRRSRVLRYSGAGGWPVGLPETIFRATAKASCDSASVVLVLGAGRTGFPKQVSERRRAEGCWTASGRNGRLINQKRTNGQTSKFGLRMADFILSRIRSLSAVKPSHFYQGLAELQFYQGRPAAVAVLSRRVAHAHFRNFGAGSWPVVLLETIFRATAEASATAMANPRRRSRALRCSGARGWPVGLPETIFRATAKASATASLALASVVLALGGGRTGFPKQVSER